MNRKIVLSESAQKRLLIATLIIFLIIATWIIYSPVLDFECINFDDPTHILEHPSLRQPNSDSFLEIWKKPYFHLYVPVVYSIWFGISFLSLNWDALLHPGFFHAANLVFHGINTILVFLILQFLLKKFLEPKIETQSEIFPAFFGALFFCWHPIQVETVAWVSCLRDLVAFMFAMLASWNYWIWDNSFEREKTPHRFYLATAFYLLGLLSKPNVAILPFFILGVSVLILKRPIRNSIRSLLLWICVGMAIAIFTKYLQPDHRMSWTPPLWKRPFIAGHALFHYLRTLAFPYPLVPDYSLAPSRVVQEGTFYLKWILPTFLLSWPWIKRKSNIILKLSSFIFLVWLFPVLGLIPFEFQTFSTVTDHYLYFPLISLALCVAAVDHRILAHKILSKTTRLTLFATLGFLSSLQIKNWETTLTLFHYNLKVNPESYLANYSLGNAYFSLKEYDRALTYYRKATSILPTSLWSQVQIGNTLIKLRKYEEASQHLQHYLNLESRDSAPYNQSSYAEMRNNLGIALMNLGRFSEARKEFQRAMQIDPTISNVHFNIQWIETLERSSKF